MLFLQGALIFKVTEALSSQIGSSYTQVVTLLYDGGGSVGYGAACAGCRGYTEYVSCAGGYGTGIPSPPVKPTIVILKDMSIKLKISLHSWAIKYRVSS